MIATYATLDKVAFPVYVLPEGHLDRVDGLLLLDDRILDDNNMPGSTLGIRRLQTHTKRDQLVPLIKSMQTVVGVIKNPAARYIDCNGKVFMYQRTRTIKVKYLKIKKIEPKEGTSTILWVRGINTPFTLIRPPYATMTWVGIIYLGDFPWIVYEFSESKKPDARKRI
jgi:hypothetical protein